MTVTVHSEPLDSDADGVPDYNDNCQLISNPAQRDGYGNFCDADLNNSGFTDFADFGTFQFQFGTIGPDADFNGTGFVDFADFGAFQFLFGKLPGPSGLAP